MRRLPTLLVLPALVGLCWASPASGQTASTRVVKGDEVSIATYPHQVALRIDGSFACGGSILDATHVVTAAHCVTDRNRNQSSPASRFSVGYGSDYRSQQQVATVSKIVVPTQYASDASYDAALVTLAQPIAFDPNAQPIKLATPSQARAAGTAIATGWGATSEGGNTSPTLKGVRVPLVAGSSCENMYGANPPLLGGEYFNIARAVCTGGGSASSDNPDTCQGDSGGPLVVDLDPDTARTDFVLLGLTSFGRGCGRRNVPAVYTWTQGDGIRAVIQPTGSNYTSTATRDGGDTSETGLPGRTTRAATSTEPTSPNRPTSPTAPTDAATPAAPPAVSSARDSTRPNTSLSKLSCTGKRRCTIRLAASDAGGVASMTVVVARKVKNCSGRGKKRFCRTATRRKVLKAKRTAGGFVAVGTLAKASYTLTAVAEDRVGNRSKRLSKRFTVR